MFLNEDLTPEKGKQAYQARQLKREGKIYQTFTQEGNVYIKETEFGEIEELTVKKIEKLSQSKEIFLSCKNCVNSV